MNIVYLDWNSQGIIHPDILKLMNEVWTTYSNPSSKHFLGQKSKKFLLDLTEELKSALDAKEYEIIFTSGATEANVFVLRMHEHAYVSNTEHPSVHDCPHAHIIPVRSDADLDYDYLQNKINQKPFLLSYMLANHETGIINDVRKAADFAHANGGYLHVDAVQAFGRIDISLHDLNADYMTICSHKHGGPIGVGALLYRKDVPIKRFSWGNSLRIGTPALPLIAGLVKSITLPRSSNEVLESEISSRFNIIGAGLNRLSNTTCIECPHKTELLMRLGFNNICVSSGAACTTSDRAQSVYAMGIDADTIRISSGWSTTEDDFAKLIKHLGPSAFSKTL